MLFWGNKNGKEATYFTKKLQISFMSNDSQSSFFNEGLDAPDDGLSIEITIEPFIESSLEVEEEQHHFTGL